MHLFGPHRDAGLVPGRVTVQHRGEWDVQIEDGEVRAGYRGGYVTRRPPPTCRRRRLGRARGAGARPSDDPGRPAAEDTLLRRAAHDPGSQATREQVVAANVDVVLVTASLAEDVNARVLERYLTLAWESGRASVILLTKADLEPDPDRVASEVAEIGGEVPVHAIGLAPASVSTPSRAPPPRRHGRASGPPGSASRSS